MGGEHAGARGRVSNFSLPALDEHLTHEMSCDSEEQCRTVVSVLLDAGTCFAVIGGEHRVRFHDRGLQAIKDSPLLPKINITP